MYKHLRTLDPKGDSSVYYAYRNNNNFLLSIRKKFLNNQFLLFVFVCSFAAVINFGSRIVLGFFMTYTNSIILAYIIGMFIAFTLCRFFVFKTKKNNPLKQFIWFSLVNVFAIFLTVVVSLFFANYGLLFIHHQFTRIEVAHFLGMCAPVLTSYMGHKYLSFH